MLCVPLRASSATEMAATRGMVGVEEGIFSARYSIFVDVLQQKMEKETHVV